MEFRVLGPIEVWHGDRPIEVAAPRQRAILALLLIHAGSVLTADRILEEIWGEDQPASGLSAVQFHISKLRSCLEPDRVKGSAAGIIATRGGGYVLDVDDEDVDAGRFEALSRRGRTLLGTDAAQAADVLESALDLWRGDPYVDFAYEPFAATEITRLNELHLVTSEDFLQARVDIGRAAEAIAHLEQLVSQYPLRERITATLMTALYQVGRQSDALRVFRDLRERLADELGIDPGPELFELEERILLHDPELRQAAEERPRHNLPSVPSKFFDRESDRAGVLELLQERRIVTLLGPGGIGKTRLALEVAGSALDHFADGAWYIDLSTATTLDDVVAAVIAGTGVAPPSSGNPLTGLARHLGPRSEVLLLDACERVVDEVAAVGNAIVAAGPAVRLLLTSRQRVNMAGEARWPVGPLPGPSGISVSDVTESPAAALFTDRARAAYPAFVVDEHNAPHVASVCRRLDGIPLAIEIAASQVSTLSVAEIDEHLESRLSFLDRAVARSPTGRRDTMRSVLEWSYDRLGDDQQLMLRRLAVFEGGFTVKAAEAVGGVEPLEPNRVLGLVEHLVDTSFVFSGSDHDRRLRLLDTVREFAVERAEAATEVDALRARHAEYYARLVADESRLLGGRMGEASWLRRLEVERENYRAACEYAIEREDAVLALRLAAHLGEYWLALGHHEEGRSMLSASLELAAPPPSPELAEALAELAMLELWNGRWQAARELSDRVRVTAEALGDPIAVYRAHRLEATLAWGRGDYRRATAEELAAWGLLPPDNQPARAYVAGSAAYMCLVTGDQTTAMRLALELEDAADDAQEPRLDSLRHEVRAWLAFQAGDDKEALAGWRAAVGAYRRLDLHFNLSDALLLAAWVELVLDDGIEARACAEEALEIARDIQSRFFAARALGTVGWAEVALGNGAVGARLIERGAVDCARSGDRFWLLWHAWNAAGAIAPIEPATAAELVGACSRLIDDIGVVVPHHAAGVLEDAAAVARDSLSASTWQRHRRAGAVRDDAEVAQLVGSAVDLLTGGT